MRSNVRSRVCNNWMIDTSILWYYGLILACVKSKIKLCVIREFPWTVSDSQLQPSPSSKGLGNEGSRGFARGLPLLQYSGQVPQPCFRLEGMTSAISTLEWSLIAFRHHYCPYVWNALLYFSVLCHFFRLCLVWPSLLFGTSMKLQILTVT